MQIKETSPGKPYAVTSIEGCTVYVEVNGALEEFESVDPNSQKRFIAPAEQIHLSDDSALFTEVFKLAPATVGGGGASWYTELMNGLAEILPDRSSYIVAAGDGKLIVHTDRISDEQMEEVNSLLDSVVPQDVEVELYNHHIEVSWKDINKYAECVTIADMLAVNPDYKKDLTSDGEWVYPLPNLTSARQIFTRANIRRITIDLPKATNLQNYVAWSRTLRYVEGEFPEATIAYFMFEDQPNLTEAYMKMPKVTTLQNSFPDAKLNKKSVLMIIEHIPAFASGSHPFTIGIHVDHQHDDEVLDAIANAEAKGWTMTVRWNGTPTAQVSTFNTGTLIYARVSELELPDGTTEQYLDWGHYVTHPEEYETFRSLESAYEYFGLEDPAELTEEPTDETE